MHRMNMLQPRILSAFACILLIAGCAASLSELGNEGASTNQPASASSLPVQSANDDSVSTEITSSDRPDETPTARAYHQAGIASWYGRTFHGRRTASGERFDMYAMTAAHRTLPLGSWIRVTLPGGSPSVLVRINDRGPVSRNRIIDLSYGAAAALGIIRRGSAQVELSTDSGFHTPS